ncbi:YczE/YyaS/YitT family protein [Paenibacillus massiliensis]|uniref:YczE/YyaS/YitT family protein n=1 Tax=Paenibacillus massiliensis TaxID=225917 RepID=UPI000687688E|nr:hypothetical protein [Paenibacillus massiliensis]
MRRAGTLRYIWFVIGIMILTLGVSLTIQSNLGASPFDALLVGLSQEVGLTVGSWELIIAIILIAFNAWLERRRPEILGLLSAFLTGLGIDMWLWGLEKILTPDPWSLWINQLLCFAAGLVITGLGTAIYLVTRMAPIPVDRLTLNLQKLLHTNIQLSRTLVYILFLSLALLLHGPIGLGTILTVCFGGWILGFFMSFTGRKLRLRASHKNT